MGVSSALHPNESRLLDTLRSLFQASSGPELGCVVVLVSLSDSDPERLSQTVANISDLFRTHIEARQLLVLQGQLGGPPPLGTLRPEDHPSPCEALYSAQKADHALLMNFAANLSEYFLMLDDWVRCKPKFISTIYWTLSAWKELPWVTLEFSSLSFAGKVFHSSDLPRLASFLLVFPRDTPTHVLLSEFPLLLAQNMPIRFGSSVFHHVGNRSGLESSCFPDSDPGEAPEGHPHRGADGLQQRQEAPAAARAGGAGLWAPGGPPGLCSLHPARPGGGGTPGPGGVL